MHELTAAVLNEVPKFVTSLVLLALAWFVGQRLSARWNLRQKQRERDLANAQEFHLLYGEFFAIWKLWNCYIRDIGQDALPGASRWNLLDRACIAEGKMEATLVRVACERQLTSDHIVMLGRFRQLYQRLRETIRDNEPLNWLSSEDPEYVEFKACASGAALLILGKQLQPNSPRAASKHLREITSNRWEN